MGARLHTRPPFVASYFEGDPPEHGSDTWYEGEGLLVHRQPSEPHPGTLALMATKGVTVNLSRLEMITPYLQHDNHPLESHLV